MHCLYYGKHLAVKITKWHNSCNTDPSAPIFPQNMQCLMGENLNKIGQELQKVQSKDVKMMKEGQNDGQAENSILP